MLHKNTIAAIILTYNEEKHIARCIQSLRNYCTEIWVIDSFSTDRTKEISEELGCIFVTHPFKNQAQQFNWAIDNCPITSGWIWRIDADEYISEALGQAVTKAVGECDENVNGIYVNKRIVFQGRALMHGGWYPAPQIKVIRKGYGRSEDKMMDEHLVVTSGKTIYINEDQTDENLNDLTWWTEKHNHYASREGINMLRMQYGLDNDTTSVAARWHGYDAERKRWLKTRYAHMPLFVRPFSYFFARYILKGGFLDGREGFIWHILQGFWYRFLVDAKIFELKKKLKWNDEAIKEYLAKEYSTTINPGGVRLRCNYYISCCLPTERRRHAA